MSKNDNRIDSDDLHALYDLVWGQFAEDREAAKEMYDDLKKYIQEEKHRYEEHGDTLAKYADLMIKQTAQVVELIKLAHKKHQKDGNLSDEDLEKIHEEIEKK